MRPIAVAALVVLFPATRAAAEGPRLTIPRVTRPPQIADFVSMNVLDAPAGMRKIEGFVQRFPNDAEPVTERTVVYVGYDDENLHVVFQCFDREPQRIGAHLVGRDLFPNDEDSVAIHIDTFRDLKHAYGFQINPLGVQTDGIYTEGSGWDLSWDAVWRSEGKLAANGYVVLVSIPFRSLRFPATDVQQWGMFFYRAIARRNEQVYWPECSTRFTARFPQAAVVDGVAHVSPGRNVQAIPYVSTRSYKAIDAETGTPSFISRRADAVVGIDGKAVIKDSVVIDGTANPDFSQVESDQPQITVNKPFEVFFPEKRPFFLENATYFTTPIPLLFTRRVANPLAGARASGRIGAYAIGAMVVDDRSPFDAPSADSKAWLGVGRVIRDVGRESYVGGFVSSRAVGGRDNHVAALDARVKLGTNWAATGQSVITSRATLLGPTNAAATGTAWFASLVGSGRRFNYELDVNDRSGGFFVADGFVPRVDIRSIDQTYSFRARPATGVLQAYGPDVVVNRTWDHDGRPLDWAATPRVGFQWPRATTLTIFYAAGRQTLRPEEVYGLTAAIVTSTNRSGFDFATALFPRVLGSATFSAGDAPNITPAGDFQPQAGRVADVTTTLSIRLSRALTVDCSYLFDRLNDTASERTVYSNGIARVRVGDQFTRALSLRGIVQYNTLSVDPRLTRLQSTRNLNYDVLLTYLTSPGTAVYTGANYNLANLDPRLIAAPGGLLRADALTNSGWQVFTKVSYLVRR
jgi:hypothetical protein